MSIQPPGQTPESSDIGKIFGQIGEKAAAVKKGIENFFRPQTSDAAPTPRTLFEPKAVSTFDSIRNSIGLSQVNLDELKKHGSELAQIASSAIKTQINDIKENIKELRALNPKQTEAKSNITANPKYIITAERARKEISTLKLEDTSAETLYRFAPADRRDQILLLTLVKTDKDEEKTFGHAKLSKNFITMNKDGSYTLEGPRPKNRINFQNFDELKQHLEFQSRLNYAELIKQS